MPYRNKVIQLYLTLFKKGTLSEKFFREFCKIFKNTFFTEYLWTTTSEHSYRQWALKIWYEYSPETSLTNTNETNAETYSGPCQASMTERFSETVSQNVPASMFERVNINTPLKNLAALPQSAIKYSKSNQILARTLSNIGDATLLWKQLKVAVKYFHKKAPS